MHQQPLATVPGCGLWRWGVRLDCRCLIDSLTCTISNHLRCPRTRRDTPGTPPANVVRTFGVGRTLAHRQHATASESEASVKCPIEPQFIHPLITHKQVLP